MIFRRFPYTTLNDINLDWIIKQVKQIAAALQGKQDKPELPGVSGQVLGLDDNLDPVWVDQGGGGGGTTNYNSLSNKPQINGVTLSGNKTAADLGLATPGDIPTVPTGSLALPLMDGEASAGTNLSRFAMEGHVHPTDTSRAPANTVLQAECVAITANGTVTNLSLSGLTSNHVVVHWGMSTDSTGETPIAENAPTCDFIIETFTDYWSITIAGFTGTFYIRPTFALPKQEV